MPESIISNALLDLDRDLAEAEALPAFKRALRNGRASFAERFDEGIDVRQLVHGAASLVDGILTRAWRRFMSDDVLGSLVAVGGYGRGELHPCSDVDLLILTGEDPTTLAHRLEPLVMFLWDIGLEVGHSIRTVEQCVDAARTDISVATNLVECRLIVGDAGLFEQLGEATGPANIWPTPEFFSAKLEEQRRRHAKFDDSGQNLEPNLKEGPGGLRDIQNIGWVAKRHFGVSTMKALLDLGFLNDHEYHNLYHGETHLWRIRFALHLLTGRHEDRLLFEHQRVLAQRFGYTDADSNLAVEQFMQDYYRRVVEIQRLNEMLLQLFEEAILLNNDLGQPERINRRFQARSGFLEVTNPGIFARYPMAMLELFLILQQHPRLQGVRASTVRLIRAHRHLIDERFRQDIRARTLFIEIFREHDGLTHATRRMHRYGILARYLPTFHAVTGLMQFDLFHVYTVDEHILMVIRNMRRFALERHRFECPRCYRVYGRLPKPELLYLAGLFHDIAKGRGGDHSELGAEDARRFCLRHDLSEFDANLVAWLVRMHLVMSRTAQHKDIDDPEVVREFAEKVATRMRLDYLYLLTVADMRGTNPGRWNSWKAALLDRLHRLTLEALERGLDQPQHQDDIILQRQAEASIQLQNAGYDVDQIDTQWMSLTTDYFLQHTVDAIVWHTELLWPPGRTFANMQVALREDRINRCTDIFVYGPDRDDLFAHSTALLDQLGLNVLSARIQVTDNGLSLSTYLVLEDDGSRIDGEERFENIRHYIEENLNSTAPPPGQPRMPRRLRSFQTASEVSFEQDEGRRLTLLNLQTSDRPGLLSLVGQAFAEKRLRLYNARIATAGAEARDTFAITDRQNRPITESDQLASIAASIKSHLDAE